MTSNEIATTTTQSGSGVLDELQHASIEARVAYAERLAESGLIPQAFQKRPQDVLVAIEWGRELGLTPIAAMKEIYVVHGQPSLSAKSMLALARRAGHRVRVEGDQQSATCEILRADDPDYPHRVTFSLDDAKQAGLLANTGWKNQPATMLRWRAVSNAVRLACPEVLGGISYTAEEMEEARRRNTIRTTATVVPYAVPDPTRSVSDFMKALGINGKQLKAFTARVLGGEVGTWESLTEEERSQVVQGLAQWEATGEDPTLTETADGELIDEETGEVQQ